LIDNNGTVQEADLKIAEVDQANDLIKSSENEVPVNLDNLTCCEKLGYRWNLVRQFCYKTVEHKYFELFIILMIVLSSAALVRNKNW